VSGEENLGKREGLGPGWQASNASRLGRPTRKGQRKTQGPCVKGVGVSVGGKGARVNRSSGGRKQGRRQQEGFLLA
jgi:hypothetical protein